jgi:hypothetical protein
MEPLDGFVKPERDTNERRSRRGSLAAETSDDRVEVTHVVDAENHLGSLWQREWNRARYDADELTVAGVDVWRPTLVGRYRGSESEADGDQAAGDSGGEYVSEGLHRGLLLTGVGAEPAPASCRSPARAVAVRPGFEL